MHFLKQTDPFIHVLRLLLSNLNSLKKKKSSKLHLQDIFIIARKICVIKVLKNSMVETDTFSQEWINCSIRYDKWSHGTLGLNTAHAVCWHYHTTVLHHGRSLSAHKSETKEKPMSKQPQENASAERSCNYKRNTPTASGFHNMKLLLSHQTLLMHFV